MSQKNGSPYWTAKVSVRRLVTIGTLSGAAVFGGVSLASASPTHLSTLKSHPLLASAGSPGMRPVVDGKVTAVGTGSFTVLDRSSTSYSVTVTGTTTFSELNVSSVGIGDVKVGTFVDVLGSVSGTTVTATRVRIEAQEPTMTQLHPAGLRHAGVRPVAAGKVTALGSNSFTITDRAGSSLTVGVTTTTTYVERGVTSPVFGDIKVGDFVALSGTITGTTVNATNVHFGTGIRHGGPLGTPGAGHMPEMPGGLNGAPGM